MGGKNIPGILYSPESEYSRYESNGEILFAIVMYDGGKIIPPGEIYILTRKNVPPSK